MFDHEGPAVTSAMCDLTIRVFAHLDITSPMYAEKSLAYMQRILRGAALKKYREVMIIYRKSAKELAGDEWNLGKLEGLYTENFWTWDKTDNTGYDVHSLFNWDEHVEFERESWLELGKCMWRKHQSV